MSTTYTRKELQEIAINHRLLLWSILAAIIANISRFYISNQAIGIVVYFAAVGFEIFTLYKLGRALKLSVIWILMFILGLFVPLIGLILLLLMHDRAMKAMKAAGIKVGFMGADPNSI